MKINTQMKLKDLKGKDLEPEALLGDALSNILLAAKEGGKAKIFALAIKCSNDKVVDVDSSDLALIKTVVEKHEPGYTILVTGQILEILESLKEEKK